MAFGMSLAVFSLVIEVTSFSRIVICIGEEKDLLCVCFSVYFCAQYSYLNKGLSLSILICKQVHLKRNSYLAAGVTLTRLRVQMCTQCVHDLQWFPSGRCYCRNRANSLTDKGGPEAVCPSAERKSSLRKVTGKEKRSVKMRETGLSQKIFSTFQEVTFKLRGSDVDVFHLCECVVPQGWLAPH